MSSASLWTHLDCTNVRKTKVYIERSKSSPLEICLRNPLYRDQAFTLAVKHIGRLGALSISGSPTEVFFVLVKHFSRPFPLLNALNITLTHTQAPIPPGSLFGGDLSSLRELSLTGVTMPLPWRRLSNLTTFNFCHVPKEKVLMTQLLDFFESAPRLRHIQLHDSIPRYSNAPAERLVPLRRLKDLSVIAQLPHSILLNHLSIPVGALLRLEFTFRGESPIPSYSPTSLDNLRNLSHITTTNLHFGPEGGFVRFNGPTGGLYIFGNRISGGGKLNGGITQFLWSLLDQFDISRSQRLAITLCNYQPSAPTKIETWSLYQTLSSMGDLHTLTLARCTNRPFILTLNPTKNSSQTVLCPKLEQLTLYIEPTARARQYNTSELLSMAKERASRGAKLSVISIINLDNTFVTAKEISQLREHVSHVEYRPGSVMPAWDALQ